MIARYLHLANAVRHRFRASHLKIELPARSIAAKDGGQIGFIDRISIEDGRLRVAGWIESGAQVTLVLAGIKAKATPNLHRIDVASVRECDPQVGFDVSLPITLDLLNNAAPAGLIFQLANPETTAPETISLELKTLARTLRRLDLRFVAKVAGLAPSALKWALTKDAGAKQRIIRQLGIDRAPAPANQCLDAAAIAPSTAPSVLLPKSRITIVLPIYNAFDLLPEVFDRVLSNTDLPFHLIVIDDASSDETVWPWLQEREERHKSSPSAHITLLQNDSNRGFIGTVNRGLDLALGDQPALPEGHTEGPVILLNSDALVPQGWASRLVGPMLADKNVATTTPMSNDAEIFSVPTICQRSDLADGTGDALDVQAARFNADAQDIHVPTGVGFCMGVSRAWITRVGSLDSVFGRGYGEEVDWCQRAREKGGCHLAVRNLFVEHRGGASFGTADKLELISNNNAIISHRYPEFDADVQRFIQSDPMLTERLALGIAWADLQSRARGECLPVYLGHSMGGGAEIYLREAIAKDIAEIGCAFVIRVGGTMRWQLELHTIDGVTRGGTQDVEMLRQMLDRAEQRHLIYSCGVGDPAPLEVPKLLVSLRSFQDKLTVLVHDFYMVSPSYTLTGKDQAFHGLPARSTTDHAHSFPTHDKGRITLEDWQAAWGEMVLAADKVITFSRDSRNQIQTAYPDITGRIEVIPHQLHFHPRPVEVAPALDDDPPIRIGVLGGINQAKGALILQEIGKRITDGTFDACITVIGDVDPTIGLPPSVTVHGSYDVQAVSDLAEHYRLTHWLIPSVWPETFSFTTREAIATGLPVLAFNLGAQAAAVGRAPLGYAIPYPVSGFEGPLLIKHLVDNIVDFMHSEEEVNGAKA